MATQPTHLLMINVKTNIHMHRTHIQGIIEYVDNNVNTEPGRDMETYSGYLYNYVGIKVDT